MGEFKAENELETALEQLQFGKLGVSDFYRVLLKSDLFVPSVGDVAADGSGFVPVIFDHKGAPTTAVFTTRSRIGLFGDAVKSSIEISARSFLAGIPDGYGVIINPGHTVSMELSSARVKEIMEG